MNDEFREYAMKTQWSPADEAAVLRMEWLKRAELAKSITCPGLLVDLSLDQHAEVREGAAHNPYTPLPTLRRLADEDLCSSIRNAARLTLSSLAASSSTG
ncbi:hypothetical protein [Planococcus lenghuensis]|uniref:Uncharacterized protein n=1 Tax=Planococcus lenghuensis TaxID=2213202 RepID=A0A1Q2L0J2_9BACL|nr:hypothetical protein [Planococcus lenghuensis]AQQ53959.1 hypothetical protein B0X71_13220 [Planococcus lenghuensis]